MSILLVFGIPVLDIGAVAAGAYLGFNNANGIDVGTVDEVLGGITLDEALKYGPTAAVTAVTAIASLIEKISARNAPQYMTIGGLNSGIHRDPVAAAIDNCLTYGVIGKETVLAGFRTAFETAIGYGLGYVAAKKELQPLVDMISNMF